MRLSATARPQAATPLLITVLATVLVLTGPASAAKPKSKKFSALDAATRVLAERKGPMNAKDLIQAMANQGLWTSPGGKTPHATLYAAMVREITDKGPQARFKKVERGLFAIA